MAEGIPISRPENTHTEGEPFTTEEIRAAFETHNNPLKTKIMLTQPKEYWTTAREFAQDIVQRDIERERSLETADRHQMFSMDKFTKFFFKTLGLK
jgi:hypothetical protein